MRSEDIFVRALTLLVVLLGCWMIVSRIMVNRRNYASNPTIVTIGCRWAQKHEGSYRVLSCHPVVLEPPPGTEEGQRLATDSLLGDKKSLWEIAIPGDYVALLARSPTDPTFRQFTRAWGAEHLQPIDFFEAKATVKPLLVTQ